MNTNKIAIPVLGTQSLNSLSSLKRFLKSIDYPVETLSIVLNNENINFYNEIRSFCDLEIEKSLIQKVDISLHPTNLGCPASWNYHFKCYPYARFFIKADDDIVFSPNDLETMVKEIVENSNDLVFYNTGTKYAFFGITKYTLKTVGLFDENIYPCNYEDDDYDRRRIHYQIKTKILSLNTLHDSSLSSRNIKSQDDVVRIQNFLNSTYEYYLNKWEGKFGNPMIWNFNFDYRENKVFRFKDYV